MSLLRLLSSSRDPAVREAARDAAHFDSRELAGSHPADTSARVLAFFRTGPERFEPIAARRELIAPGGRLPIAPGRRLAGCLVTPIDGQGIGSIAVSASQSGQRRTAAFLCDVQLGICDVVGDVEPESPRAGRLVVELGDQVREACVRDVPELALGLLAGNLLLCEGRLSRAAADWLTGVLGPGFEAAAFPACIPGLDPALIPGVEVPERARAVLGACPTWLDVSPLTLDLAREISLREGKVAADPERDAGAYRY
jgi:hypothetical protein